MEVFHFVAMAPNKWGPVEVQLVEMCRRGAANGYRARHFFTGEPAAWYVDLMSRVGGTIERLPARPRTAILNVCLAEQPDVAHFHVVDPWPMARQLAANGTLLVRTIHSYRHPKNFELARSLVRHHRARHVDAFIAVSNYIAEQCRRDFLIPRRRIHRIYNGVDLERFSPPAPQERASARMALGVHDDRPLITVAAHLHPNKRQGMLIHAMPIVWHEYPDAVLVVAGGGEDEGRLRAAAEQASGDIRVLTGDNDVARLYQASDIAVLPSAGEGLPGSAVEALACGLPLVVTPGGGLQEVPEDGVTGLVVRDQTPMGLAIAVLELLAAPARRVSMGRAARQRAESCFDVQRAARETMELYAELTDHDGPLSHLRARKAATATLRSSRVRITSSAGQ